MKNANESFNHLFERYLFRVADAFIDQAEPSTQADLMRLLTKMNQDGDESIAARGSDEPTEWEQLLKAPVDWHSVDQQWLVCVRQAQQNRHRRYIVRLEQAIESTHERLQKLHVLVMRESYRSQLMAYYEQTLLSYRQRLARANQLFSSN